ncbi:hypothetical protein [Aeromicrobium sp. Leaf291]|uniref:hypothetical protein n=1 Tax=Aeromicrobium sp. Leaf291 TaxID=1736325 RepID=UPI0006F45FDB|nr:hypothetical protein [Aeromicrobium sp. Leaf291]KQP81564.1 hypothetical protein ASF35_16165 [Aeromicrobium sp. Leaf291]
MTDTTSTQDQGTPLDIDAIIGDLSTQVADQARTIAIIRTTAAHWQNVAASQAAELAVLKKAGARSGSPAKKAAAKKPARRPAKKAAASPAK